MDNSTAITASPKAAALETIRPHFSRLGALDLMPLRRDVPMLLEAARALYAVAQEEGPKAALSRLSAKDFDPQTLSILAHAPTALEHATEELERALSQPKKAEVPAELQEKASVLKERMLRVARYYLEDDAEAGPAIAALGRKKLPGELAADLRKLASLYAQHRATLAGDQKHYRADDASDAEAMAKQISAALSGFSREAVQSWTDAAMRAQALLSQAHAEVRAALAFLLRRDEGALARLPEWPAAQAPRGRPRKAKSAGEDAAAPAESNHAAAESPAAAAE